jgi:2-succinyl-5-enolpyruvyl-6-hydroxy-3-cyclohexene-1-carboxylate synthase
VHVNVRARKPLEPAAASDRSGGSHIASGAGESAPQRGAPFLPRPLVVPDETAVLELVERCARAERPLVACGPGPLARAGEERTALLALLRRLGFPVFAEVTSQLRLVDADAGAGIAWCDELAVVLDAEPARQGLRPDLVLQIGAPPVSAGFEDLLEGGWVREHLVVAEHGHPDPVSTATLVVQAPLAATARAWLGALETRPSAPAAPAWLGTVRAWCAAARAAIEDVLREAPAAPGSVSAARGDAIGEGALARAVVEALPAGALLALGNSLPIRSAETFAPPRNRPLRVWSQRGLAGIDGLVSGVAGTLAALGREPAPPAAAALLVGDLSFLHDLGGLATLRRVETPFAVVVVQNRGGRIFEQLPLAAGALAGALPHFVMSQDLDVASAAAAFGLPCARVADRAQLDAALRSAFARGGATVIEALVPEHAAAAERAALRRAMSAAVVSPPGVGSGP